MGLVDGGRGRREREEWVGRDKAMAALESRESNSTIPYTTQCLFFLPTHSSHFYFSHQILSKHYYITIGLITSFYLIYCLISIIVLSLLLNFN